MFKKLKGCYETFIKSLFSSEEDEPDDSTDSVFNRQNIIVYGTQLRSTELPMEQRAKAAASIGLLAYTGEPNAGTYASEYIQDLYDILLLPDISAKVKILVLQGLAGICYINYNNQNKAKDLNLTDAVLACLDEDKDSSSDKPEGILVKSWTCYFLTVMCYNNIPYIKILHEKGGEMLENKLELLASLDWSSWPCNYAELLSSLLGFQKSQNTSNT
ncbi:uncharacterized protein C6orf229 homolog [Alligator sinensis]|uniref:Uncharacterized protein C6orf229 homolog n=1 Tax=Alligator sinensis TaxID=38654 RepID=A0A1U7SB63_ALLSI|nr:uncharacterized protein C6orf229 homolog [Alligator sinensis]